MKIKTFRRHRGQPTFVDRIKNLFIKKQTNKPRKPIWKRLFKLGIIVGIILITVSILYAAYFLPSVKNAAQLDFAQSTIIYDRGALENPANLNDHILYIIHGDENREYVPLKEISPWIRKATISIEDDQFYSHFGFDIPALIKAVLHQIGIGNARGGSTITQQLVKNTFLSNEKTFLRKYNELLLSVKMELAFSKDEILEMYLNKIPYGSNAHGIEAASRKFFGKSSRNLTIAESTVLASLPQRPTKLSPYGSHKDLLMGFYEYDEKNDTGKTYKKGRKDLVLQRMLDTDQITFEQFKVAFSESKNLKFREKRDDIKAPYFVFLVRQQLEEKYGKEFLKNGGFHIYTTLDHDLQNIAEKIIAEKTGHYAETYGATNVAMAAIDPDNGQILAYIGGKDYFNQEIDGQVDVLTSLRQPGSSIKPLIYQTAFEKGYSPSTIIFDTETDFGGGYIPRNFDGEYRGPVSARNSLNSSLNVAAIKMAYLADPRNIFKNAEKLGIKMQGKPSDHGVALGIGVAEIEPLHHIASFQAFARDGSLFEPSSILEIRDSNGKTLEKFDIEKVKKDGIEPESTALVREILTDEASRPTTDGFDWNKLLQLEGIDNGAKTGTSNRPAKNPNFNPELPESNDNPKTVAVPSDSWTIGFTPNLVAGVWVGNNRGKPMKSGATGMTVAAPVWKKFMTEAHKVIFERNPAKKDKKYPTVPLEKRQINKFTGKLISEKTPEKLIVDAVFASYSLPTEKDIELKKVEVDRISGRRATRFTPSFAKKEEYVLSLNSLKPNLPNWETPVQEWIKKHSKFMSSLGEILVEDDENEEFNQNREMSAEEYEKRLTRLERLLVRRNGTSSNSSNRNNIFSRGFPPKLSILSPKNKGTISTGEVGIAVSVSSKNGIKKIEFYFDDKLISTKIKSPWTEKIQIPAKIKAGSQHIISVIAIDNKDLPTKKEITVNIAPDKNGPSISFLGPLPNQKIPANSQIDVLLSVQDFESSIKAVEILYNGESLGYIQSLPFHKTINIGAETGKKFITAHAWDVHNNLTKKSIPLFIQTTGRLENKNPEITTVKAYREVISATIVVPNPENIEWLDFSVSRDGESIFAEKISNPTNQTIIFQIPKTGSGLAKLKLQTKLVNNKRIRSTQKEIKF